MSDNPTQQERDKYLEWMDQMSVDEEGNETISADLLQIYRQYVDIFRTQYPEREFTALLDQIKTYPAINTQYWKMFGLVWEQLSRAQQESLFERFAGMDKYRWLLDQNLQSMWIAPSIAQPFLHKAYAVAALGMLTDRYEPAKLQKATLLDDLMWLEYNINMRDWDKVYRDIDGWGIISSKPSVGLIPDIHMEVSGGYFEELLRDNIALDDEIKRRIIDYYETYSLEQIESLISIMEHERGEFFLFSMDEQATTVRELVEAKSHEWEEILSYYGRSQS